MNDEKRINHAKSNHVCFSCLKIAGREHTQANCKRGRQCTIGVASLQENEKAMLRVTSADIFGSNNRLFDFGAQ